MTGQAGMSARSPTHEPIRTGGLLEVNLLGTILAALRFPGTDCPKKFFLLLDRSVPGSSPDDLVDKVFGQGGGHADRAIGWWRWRILDGGELRHASPGCEGRAGTPPRARR